MPCSAVFHISFFILPVYFGLNGNDGSDSSPAYWAPLAHVTDISDAVQAAYRVATRRADCADPLLHADGTQVTAFVREAGGWSRPLIINNLWEALLSQ
mmetsp:Transcript_18312/g.24162  ORF Transcript_18312/g.24162 Transcript_18312/m.24162 type:complete len:98 (+) Transcript_18312:451-744(+)